MKEVILNRIEFYKLQLGEENISDTQIIIIKAKIEELEHLLNEAS